MLRPLHPDVARCSVATKYLARTLANINYISLPDSTINHFTGVFFMVYFIRFMQTFMGKFVKWQLGVICSILKVLRPLNADIFSLWLFNPFKATYPTISNWVLNHHAVKLVNIRKYFKIIVLNVAFKLPVLTTMFRTS